MVVPLETVPILFGVAVNGVPFEAGTAEFWNGDRAWNYEAKSGKIDLGLDQNDAHVQPGGVYHYHGLPTGLVRKLGDDGTKMIHLGANTKSRIVAKGISAGKSTSTYRGLVSAHPKAKGARNFTQCDSLLIGKTCAAHTIP